MQPSKGPGRPSAPLIVGKHEATSPPGRAADQLTQQLSACHITGGWNFSRIPEFSDRHLNVINTKRENIKYLNFFHT